jgi:hypothetical protein
MTHRHTHSRDTSARLAAAAGTQQCRYGASWIAPVGVLRVERDARPAGRASSIALVGDRGIGRRIVSAGGGAGGDTR